MPEPELKGYIDSNGEIGVHLVSEDGPFTNAFGGLLTRPQLEELNDLTRRMIEAKPFEGIEIFLTAE